MPKTMLLRPSVCAFLQYLQQANVTHLEKRVLECGAGGRYPPLALFFEEGYETIGIDISDHRIGLARAFCREHNISLTYIKGDMRDIPFGDEVFSFVYESDSLCRLTKKDTGSAVKEMKRVLRRGGYLSVGFMTLDSYPLTGEERHPGEFWTTVGERDVVHSFFGDDEPSQFLTDLEIVWEERRTTLRRDTVTVSREDWIAQYDDTWTRYSKDEWIKLYNECKTHFRLSVLQYIARKTQ